MAGSTMQGGHGGRGNSSVRRVHRMSDINVTPFVDVMLVLLVVFMITAPLIATTVPVNLPRVEAKNLTDDKERLSITVDGEGKLFLMDTAIETEILAARLRAIQSAKQDQRISLRANSEVRHGAVLDVMKLIHEAGFKKIDLIFDPVEAAMAAQRAQRRAAQQQRAAQP